MGNPGCFYTGGQSYGIRLFLICYFSQYFLDYYTGSSQVSEFWQPARFNYQGGLDYDVHEPFTDAFNKMMVSRFYLENQSEPGYSIDNKSQISTV